MSDKDKKVYMKKEEIYEKFVNEPQRPFLITPYLQRLYEKEIKNKRYKKATIIEIVSYAKQFDFFLSIAHPELEELQEINHHFVNEFKDFCVNYLKNTPKTINKKLRAIRKVFNYLVDIEQKIPYNPALRVHYLKQDKEALPKSIPISELRIIIEELEKMRYGIRDSCITLILFHLGMKLSDVLAIKFKDINLTSKELMVEVVEENDKKKYTYPLIEELYVKLKEYLFIRQDFPSKVPDNQYLFLSHTGNVYTQRSYQYRFYNAVAKNNLCKYTPRNVRASFFYNNAKRLKPSTLSKITRQKKVEHYYVKELKEDFKEL